jgi:hypothetical protein
MHVGFDGNDIESNKEISSVEPFAAAPRNIHNLIKYIYNIRENVFFFFFFFFFYFSAAL